MLSLCSTEGIRHANGLPEVWLNQAGPVCTACPYAAVHGVGKV